MRRASNEAACLAAGFDGYLLKPYRQRELLEAIAAVVEPGASSGRPSGAGGAGAASGGTVTAVAGTASSARLDWDSALESVGGDDELLAKVMDGFLGQHPALVAEFRTALDAGRSSRDAARGAYDCRLAALVRRRPRGGPREALEDRCREGAPAPAAEAWGALEPELDAVVGALRDRVQGAR